MPKSSDKKNGQKRSRTPKNNNNNSKRRKVVNPTEGIEVSKQLASKTKGIRTSRSSTKVRSKSSEARVCGNGKPMPSLADLERMFEESGDDEEQVPRTTVATESERCKTPVSKPIFVEEKLKSPTTLRNIASKIIDMISNGEVPLDTTIPVVATPIQPVIPQKKPKKSGIPYIIGCNEREQVPWNPKVKLGVGNKKFGLDSPESTNEDEIKPRKRRGTKVNISKSIFNAKSNEIADRLKESEYIENQESSIENTNNHGGSSPDSCKTVAYDYNDSNSPSGLMTRSFSPLPSTSRDNEVFLKNAELFNESLQNNLSCHNDSSNDVELIELPCETIVINDSTLNNIEIKKSPNHTPNAFTDDDCCIIVEPENKRARTVISPIEIKDDVYATVDLSIDYNYNDDVCEIINVDDVDDIVAGNKALIEKYKNNHNTLDTVTFVDPNCSYVNEDRSTRNTGVMINESLNIAEGTVPESIDNSNIHPLVPNTAPPSRNFKNNSNNLIEEVVTSFFVQLDSSTILNKISNSTNNSLTNKLTSIWKSAMEALFSDKPEPPIVTDTIDLDVSRQNSRCNIPPPNNTQAVSVTSVEKSPKRFLDCPICMDPLANNVASTLCGHVFCMPCIKAAIRTNGKRCPTCRKVLKGAGFHQLFL